MESENEEDGLVSYKNKYRQLKSRLKYLIYEHECFENDIQKAQTKLLQLSRDKSFLLDQLMRYEAVVLSGGEEETDYSSGEETVSHSTTVQEHAGETQRTDSASKSDAVEETAKSTAPPSSVRVSQLSKQGVSQVTSLLHPFAANTNAKTSVAKTGDVKKVSKSSNKVSAVAAAKITKAVARARQNPPSVSTATSPLIVSLPLNATSLSGQSKQSQATPTKLPQMASVTSTSSTAAILASIPAPPKPPVKLQSSLTSTLPSGKGLTAALAARQSGSRASSSSSSSSSSDSEDSGSDSSSSSSSREEPMETGGPVPMVHSVHIPAGGPQLVRPKAIVSPVKAPPQLIPVDPLSASTSTPNPPLLSPLTSPGTQSQATRFLWSNRSSSDGQNTPTTGFISIAPPLTSPTALTKPCSGSAFQLVTSPPGSATLHRPPSLQDLSGGDTGRPHPLP